MRRLMIFLMIVLLVSACSPKVKPVPADPSLLEPGVEEPDPGDGEDPDPTLPNGEIIWQLDPWPDLVREYFTEGTLVSLAADRLSGVRFEDGSTQWNRDLAGEGFALCVDLLYESQPLLTASRLTYPVQKNDRLYIEQLDVITGRVVWQFDIGPLSESGYFVEEDLIEVLNYNQGVKTYYSLDTGQEFTYLSGSQAYCRENFHYAFSQAQPYTVAKYDSQSGKQLWQIALAGDMDQPYFGEVIGQKDTPIFGITEFFRDQVRTTSVAVDGKTGKILWTKLGDPLGASGGKALLRNEGSLAIIDVATGQENEVVADVNDANYFLYRGSLYISERQSLTKIELSTGAKAWEQPMPSRIDSYYGFGVVDTLEGMDVIWVLMEKSAQPGEFIYDQLAAIDPATGSTIAVYPFIPEDDPFAAWPLNVTTDSQGRSYVILEERSEERYSFQLIDANTGSSLLQQASTKGSYYTGLLFDAGDSIVFALADSPEVTEVLFFAKRNGSKQSHFRVGGVPHLLMEGKLLIKGADSKRTLVAPPR